MAEPTANADSSASFSPPKIVVEAAKGIDEAPGASPSSDTADAAMSSAAALPDCPIASSDRFKDLRPYCDRIWTAEPQVWDNVFPEDYPRNPTKADEENFLRRFFDDTEIHMQGGAHGQGLGFRFLKQVWWSIALYNANTLAPYFATKWWQQEENAKYREDPKMRAAILSNDAQPGAFFQPEETKAHNQRFLQLAVRCIQQQLRDSTPTEDVQATRNISGTTVSSKSTEINTSANVKHASRIDSLPSASVVSAAPSSKDIGQPNLSTAQDARVQALPVKPTRGGTAGSRVSMTDYFNADSPVLKERIRSGGRVRKVSNETGGRGGRGGHRPYDDLSRRPSAPYMSETDGIRFVQPGYPIAGYPYQPNDQNAPPVRKSFGAEFQAGNAHPPGLSQAYPHNPMGQRSFPPQQYLSFQDQAQLNQSYGPNQVYALSSQDAQFHQQTQYGQQTPYSQSQYVDNVRLSAFDEPPSNRGGGRFGSQISRGGGSHARGRGANGRHPSYDGVSAGGPNIGMQYEDTSTLHGHVKKRRPSKSSTDNWRGGSGRPDGESSRFPGPNYFMRSMGDHPSPTIQRHNMSAQDEPSTRSGQPYVLQAQTTLRQTLPASAAGTDSNIDAPLRSGFLCGLQAKAPEFCITPVSIGSACRHVLSLAVFNIPPSCNDDDLQKAIADMSQKPVHLAYRTAAGPRDKPDAKHADYAFIEVQSHLDALAILAIGDRVVIRDQALSIRVPKRYWDPADDAFLKFQPDPVESGSLAYYQRVCETHNSSVSYTLAQNAGSSSMPYQQAHALPSIPSIIESDPAGLSTIHSEDTTPVPSSTATPKKNKSKKPKNARDKKATREAETARKVTAHSASQVGESAASSGTNSQVKDQHASEAVSDDGVMEIAEVKRATERAVKSRGNIDGSTDNSKQSHGNTIDSSKNFAATSIEPHDDSVDPSTTQAANVPTPVTRSNSPVPVVASAPTAHTTPGLSKKQQDECEVTGDHTTSTTEPDNDDSFHTAHNSPPLQLKDDDMEPIQNTQKPAEVATVESNATDDPSREPVAKSVPAATRKPSGFGNRNASAGGQIPIIPKRDSKAPSKSSSGGQQKPVAAPAPTNAKPEPMGVGSSKDSVKVVKTGSDKHTQATDTTSVPPTPSFETAPSTPALPDMQIAATETNHFEKVAPVETKTAAKKPKGPSQTEPLNPFAKKAKPPKQKKPAKGKGSVRGKPPGMTVDAELANRRREAAETSGPSTLTPQNDDSPEHNSDSVAKNEKAEPPSSTETSSSNKPLSSSEKAKRPTTAAFDGADANEAATPSVSPSQRKLSPMEKASNYFHGLRGNGKASGAVGAGAVPSPANEVQAANTATDGYALAEEHPQMKDAAASKVDDTNQYLQVGDVESPSTATMSPHERMYTPASTPGDNVAGFEALAAGDVTGPESATQSPAHQMSRDAPPSSSKKSKRKKKSKGKDKATDTERDESLADATDADEELVPQGIAFTDRKVWTPLDEQVTLFVTRSDSPDEDSASASASARNPSKSAGEKAREAIAARSASSSGNLVTAPHPRNVRLKRSSRTESANSASSTSSSEAARASSPPPVKRANYAFLFREQNKVLILTGADPVQLQRQQKIDEERLSTPGFGNDSNRQRIEADLAQEGPEALKRYKDAMWGIDNPGGDRNSSDELDSEEEEIARVSKKLHGGKVLGEVHDADGEGKE